MAGTIRSLSLPSRINQRLTHSRPPRGGHDIGVDDVGARNAGEVALRKAAKRARFVPQVLLLEILYENVPKHWIRPGHRHSNR